MRVPVELLVLACLVVGIFPAWSIGPVLDAAARPVVGGALPAYSLAVWHGFNAPLADEPGGAWRAASLRLRRASPSSSSAAASSGAPLIHRLDGKRLFERALAAHRRGSRAGCVALPRHAAAAAAAAAGGGRRRCAAALGSALVVPLDMGRPAARARLTPAFVAALAGRLALRASAPRGRPSSTGSPR